MKKVIIIAMLLTIICVCGVSAGVCFADETTPSPNDWYYYDGTTRLAMRESADDTSKVLLYIPRTYAFEKLEEANGAFVKVRYNGIVGYIDNIYFENQNYCKKVTSKWGNNPYSYDLSDLTVKVDDIITYDIKTMEADPYPTRKSDFHISTIYGYCMKGSDYYFLIDAVIDYRGNSDKYTLYIKATDTNRADFNEADIKDSAGYTLQTTIDKPSTPGDEITSGNPNNTNPPADKNGSNTQTPKNSLDRYILIAVIAVLCVVIVILIFVPTRKRS